MPLAHILHTRCERTAGERPDVGKAVPMVPTWYKYDLTSIRLIFTLFRRWERVQPEPTQQSLPLGSWGASSYLFPRPALAEKPPSAER